MNQLTNTRAFISYSHSDEQIVKRLLIHMSQLKRENLLSSWFDGEIMPGDTLDENIANELNRADIFFAVVSPDYLHSAYCFDVEFQQALNYFQAGRVRIVPIIAQPCDWKSSPFGRFKAIPKDGKPISEWTNENNAFLNIIDDLRKLVSTAPEVDRKNAAAVPVTSRQNYKVKRDFDPVDLLNFGDESFDLIYKYFKDAVEEINGVDQIRARFVYEENMHQFTCVVTNRAKIGTTGYISIGLRHRNDHFGNSGISYALSEHLDQHTYGNVFSIEHDDYRLFWKRQSMMYSREKEGPMEAKEIAETLWDEFIDQVGINR